MSFDRFVGLPWLDRGRDGGGVDCWGLLALVYAAHGMSVPSYAGSYASAEHRAEVASLIAGALPASWQPIAAGDERALDAVLMREGRIARHVAVVTRPGLLLHVSEGATSRIESYRTGLLRHRVVGFYRLRAP